MLAPLRSPRLPPTACLVVALVWTAIVYWPILDGYFYGDDFGNLFLTVNVSQLEYVLQPSPGHIVYVPRLCYALLYRLAGPEPRAFFATMLLTHLVNVALLFALGRRLTRNAYVAALAAALWGGLRINEGTLGWYAVYGHVVATTIVVVVLLRLAVAAERGSVTTAAALGWCALLLVGCVSFGSAVPVAFVFPLVAWLVLPAGALSVGARRALIALPVVVPVGYAFAYGMYVLAYGRDEKNAALLFWLMWQAPLRSITMTADLFRAGVTALAYGATALPAPTSVASYAAPGVAAVALGVGAWWSPSAVRRWIAALLLMAAAVYVFIALGRGLAFADLAVGGWTPRYHYLPTLLLSVVLALALARAADATGRPDAVGAAAFALWLGTSTFLWARGDWVIDQHRNMRAMTERALQGIQGAVARAPGTGPAIIPNQPFHPALADPWEIGGWAGLYSIYRPRTDREVLFSDSPPAVRANARPGSPLASLLAPAR